MTVSSATSRPGTWVQRSRWSRLSIGLEGEDARLGDLERPLKATR